MEGEEENVELKVEQEENQEKQGERNEKEKEGLERGLISRYKLILPM